MEMDTMEMDTQSQVLNKYLKICNTVSPSTTGIYPWHQWACVQFSTCTSLIVEKFDDLTKAFFGTVGYEMERKILSAKLTVMKNLYQSLDATFKESLQDNSLSRLLNIEDANLFTPFLNSVLTAKYYDPINHIFKIQEHILGVTLQDVLYLTGLPIQGKPVIVPDVPDLNAYERVFGAQYRDKTSLSFSELKNIAVNTENNHTRRMIAVLVVVFGAFIAPDPNKHQVSSVCVKYIENVDQVDTYAMGAALLAFTYRGISGSSNPSKNISGNLWVVLGSLLIRLPGLQNLLDVDLKNYPQEQREGAPLLPWILRQVQKTTRNHYAKYTIESFLSLVQEVEIIWRPYEAMACPRPLDNDCVRDITPMFCNNIVKYHMPHICNQQFREFELYDVGSVTWTPSKIEFKHRKGGQVQKQSKYLEQQLLEWGSRKPAEQYMTLNEPQGEGEHRGFNDSETGQRAEDIMRPKEILVYTRRKRIVDNDNNDSGREDEWERNVREDEQKDEQNDERVSHKAILATLEPERWIHIEIISYYISYLKRTISSKALASSILLDCYTYSKWKDTRDRGTVLRKWSSWWTGRFDECSYILFPICVQ